MKTLVTYFRPNRLQLFYLHKVHKVGIPMQTMVSGNHIEQKKGTAMVNP